MVMGVGLNIQRVKHKRPMGEIGSDKTGVGGLETETRFRQWSNQSIHRNAQLSMSIPFGKRISGSGWSSGPRLRTAGGCCRRLRPDPFLPPTLAAVLFGQGGTPPGIPASPPCVAPPRDPIPTSLPQKNLLVNSWGGSFEDVAADRCKCTLG